MFREFQKAYWLGLAAAAALAAAYACQRDFGGLFEEHAMSQEEIRTLRGRLEALREEETRLQSQVQDLENDSVELEAALRRTKNLVREGEKVYRIELGSEPSESGFPGAEQPRAARQTGSIAQP